MEGNLRPLVSHTDLISQTCHAAEGLLMEQPSDLILEVLLCLHHLIGIDLLIELLSELLMVLEHVHHLGLVDGQAPLVNVVEPLGVQHHSVFLGEIFLLNHLSELLLEFS